MNHHKAGLPIVSDVTVGLFAPLQSLRFLLNNKFVLFIGLAPQVLGLVAYVWLSVEFLFPYVDTVIMENLPESWGSGIFSAIAQVIVGLVMTVIYALAFLPLVGAIASPLYDYVAERTFEKISGRKLPKQGLGDLLYSMGSELAKLLVYYVLLALTFFVSPLAPLFLVFSIWYLGWDLMDRTLTLMNLPLNRRVLFGVRRVLACLCLGIWAYIPIVGAAMGFALAAAGALSVARLTPPEQLRIFPLKQPENSSGEEVPKHE